MILDQSAPPPLSLLLSVILRTMSAIDRAAARMSIVGASDNEWRAVRPFVWMLACSGVLCLALTYDKYIKVFPLLYAHFLVSYEFGLIKRGLIGEVASLFLSKVSYHHVVIIGMVAWLTTLGTYLAVFRKTFTFSLRTLPLLAIVLGSPFFFKNFMFSIGFFDIFGCLAALIALLLPVNVFLPLVLGTICGALLLVHHLHFLLYVPTIAFIVIVRALAIQRLTLPYLAAGLIAALAVTGLFLYLAFNGSVSVPMPVFIDALRARATAPDYITSSIARIWYTDIRYEIQQTMAMLPGNALRFPIYLALMFIHLPLIAYFRQMIRGLARPYDRIVVTVGLVVITLGYIPIFIVVYDYSRWVSNWVTCMILTMHAVRLLPSTDMAPFPIDPMRPRNRWFGWLVTIIPRVGIIKPF
jgi:hypothetical protein